MQKDFLSRIVATILFSMVSLGTYAETGINSDQAHPFVITGVVVNSGASKMIGRFVAYLSQESGYPMRPVFVSTYSELSSLLREHPYAVGWTCGAPFVEDNTRDGQQLLGVPLLNGKPLYDSLVIRARGREEQSLADFGDQVFAYSDPRSNSGLLVPSYSLAQQGTDIRKHFRLLLHAGNHERSIIALLNGMADVAAIDEYVWIEYVKNHPRAGELLEVIERIGPYPFTPLVAGQSVPPATVDRLRASLTGMQNSSRGKKFLEEFGFDGFVEQPVSFYQPIEDMMEVLNWPLD